MTIIPTFTVTYYRGDPSDNRITVEVFADDQQAIARRDQLAARGIFAVAAEQGMRIGR